MIAAVVPLLCLAADPAWNPADAAKEAKQAIRVGHIKFYWAGSVGVGRVGVSIKVRKSIQGLMPELAVSPTTYHFGSGRKNMPGGATRRYTATFCKSTRSHFSTLEHRVLGPCARRRCTLLAPEQRVRSPLDTQTKSLCSAYAGLPRQGVRCSFPHQNRQKCYGTST